MSNGQFIRKTYCNSSPLYLHNLSRQQRDREEIRKIYFPSSLPSISLSSELKKRQPVYIVGTQTCQSYLVQGVWERGGGGFPQFLSQGCTSPPKPGTSFARNLKLTTGLMATEHTCTTDQNDLNEMLSFLPYILRSLCESGQYALDPKFHQASCTQRLS